MVVKIDGWQLQHLCFADDIVSITLNISQAERMLTDFDDASAKIGLHLNLAKTMFMRNGWVPDGFPIHAQQNGHIRMLKLSVSRSQNQHGERPTSRAGQEEMSRLESVQEH